MEITVQLVVLLMGVAFLASMIDAMAGGGGLLNVPALLATGLPPVAALATNKVQSAFGTASAVVAYARRGHLEPRRFALPTLAALAGSAAGAWVLTLLDPGFLAGLIPLLLVAIALYYAFGPKPREEDRHVRAGRGLLLATVFAIGSYDGFFGPGTGSFFTTALIAVFGFGFIRAVAHTKLLNFASNMGAVVVLVAGGHVVWAIALPMAAASAVGGQAGAWAAMRFGPALVRPLLVLMCLGLTAKLVADPANPLTQAAMRLLG